MLSFLKNLAAIHLSYFVVFLMYNFFAATEFSWDDVKVDKHRENYIGHSIKAAVGRWQKGIYSCSQIMYHNCNCWKLLDKKHINLSLVNSR